MSKVRDSGTGTGGKGRAEGGSPATGDDRQVRLARQLRANLKKRKAQQRRRKAPESAGGGKGENATD